MFPARVDRFRVSSALFLLLLAPLASGQGRYLWSDTYAGPAQLSDDAYALALGAHGEVFVAGSSSNGLDTDALILGYDAYGQRLWERRIDLGAGEYATGLAYDAASGALYAAGSNSTTPPAALLWRLDPLTGTVVWQQVYSGPQQQGALFLNYAGLAIDSSGGLVFGGYLGSSQHDFLVARFDSSGSPTWTWSAPTPGSQYGYTSGLAIAPGGEIVVHVSESVPGVGTQHTFHELSAAGVPIWSAVVGATDTGCAGPRLDAAANVYYSINVGAIGGHRIGKLDPAGNPLWSVDAQSIFGVNTSTYGLAVDVQGDVVAGSSDSTLARFDTNGNLLWTAGVPASHLFDIGFWGGLQMAPNGDTVLRMRGHTPGEALDYDSVARFDAAGQFLWSQSIRAVEPGVEVQTQGMVLAPQGSVLLAGYSLAAPPASRDLFLVAVHEQSHAGCFGDGSSGACPCNNNVPAGTPSGCRRSGSVFGARLDDQGIASLGSDSLRFYAQGLNSNGLTMLLQGRVAPAPLAQQDGLLCLSGPVLRMYSSTPTSVYADLPPAGAARVHARSAALGDVLLPGSTRAYQLYFRGATGLCGAGNGNFTNSVVVDWAP
jgi:hypothetical protein